jgi:hypothetical protein
MTAHRSAAKSDANVHQDASPGQSPWLKSPKRRNSLQQMTRPHYAQEYVPRNSFRINTLSVQVDSPDWQTSCT